jgi:hypothetical protein
VNPLQAGDPHQPRDPLVRERGGVAAEVQLGAAAADAVGAPGPGVHVAQQVDQVRVSDVADRGAAVSPLVVAGGRNLQHSAGHRDREPLRGQLKDQTEPYFGSTFSRAK